LPGVALVTVSEIVQDEAAARVAPERLTVPPPTVALPPQVLVRPLVTVSRGLIASVKATPVSPLKHLGW